MTLKLYFTKTHIETGAVFEDYFSNKNCKDWDETMLSKIEQLAIDRMSYLNSKLNPTWEYKIIGWRCDEDN